MTSKIFIIILGILLLAIVVFFAFRKKEKKIKENFPWDKRTVLVFYAGNSGDINPNENTPSIIIAEYDDVVNFMLADGVPYLSVLDKDQMLDELESFYKKAKTQNDKLILDKVQTWVKAKIEENYIYFLYELEPPELAGKAYPIAVETEKLMD